MYAKTIVSENSCRHNRDIVGLLQTKQVVKAIWHKAALP